MPDPDRPPKPEAEVVPIDRGVDIRLRGVQEIRNRALALHRRYAKLESRAEELIRVELAKPVEAQEVEKLERLHAELARVEAAVSGLDRIISESFDEEDALRDEWIRLVERLAEADRDTPPLER